MTGRPTPRTLRPRTDRASRRTRTPAGHRPSERHTAAAQAPDPGRGVRTCSALSMPQPALALRPARPPPRANTSTRTTPNRSTPERLETQRLTERVMRGARRPPNAVLGTTTRSGRPHKTRPRAVPAGAAAGSSRGEAPEAPDDPTLGRNPSEPRHGRRPLPEAAGGPARAGPPATTDPAAGPSDARLHWYSTRSRRPRSSRTAQRRHDAGTRRRREPPRRVRGSDLGPAGARAQRAARARRRLRSRQPSSRQGRGMLAEGIPEQRSYDRRSAGLTWRASAPRDRQRPAAAPPGTREPPARAARPVRAIAHPTERCERPPAPPASPDQRTDPPRGPAITVWRPTRSARGPTRAPSERDPFGGREAPR